MGPSGSGKSTLLHILAGLDRPTDGLGRDRRHAPRRPQRPRPHPAAPLRRSASSFRAYNLLPVLTAEENITLPLRIGGQRPDREWLETLDRRGRARRPADAPSGRDVRGPAAARRRGARTCHAARRRLRRRADGQPRLGLQPRDPRAPAPRRGRPRPDHRHGHPRPAGGRPSPTASSSSPTAPSPAIEEHPTIDDILDHLRAPDP